MNIPLKEAKKLGIVDNIIRDLTLSAILDGKKFIETSPYDYQLATVKYNEYKEQEKKLSQCAKRNNKGITFEKAGKIKSAIRVYEENITDGYPAHHSYKRLMILYHKQKDYENEIRVIERALEVFGNYPEYNDRLIKVNKLIE